MAVSRFEAEQGQTVRLRVFFYRNGSPFDPDSFDHIEIRKRTGAATSDLVDTIAIGAITQEAQGTFYVDWPIPDDQEVGSYIDRWFFTASSGGSVESDDASFVIVAEGTFIASSGYITVDEVLETYLPGSTLTESQIGRHIDEATEIIESTGRKFGAQSLTIDVDGTGESWVVSPQNILSIDSITIIDCDGDERELDPAHFVIKGRWLIHKDHLPWPHSGERDTSFFCGCPFGDFFPRGQKNVRLSGQFGLYATVPALIKRAAGLIVMYLAIGGIPTTPGAYNYDSESKEQHSYTRRSTDLLGRVVLRGFTGIPEVDAILNRYRAIAPKMTVI